MNGIYYAIVQDLDYNNEIVVGMSQSEQDAYKILINLYNKNKNGQFGIWKLSVKNGVVDRKKSMYRSREQSDWQIIQFDS